MDNLTKIDMLPIPILRFVLESTFIEHNSFIMK